jgi:ketosteroid isomerase-like protein
VLTHLPRRPAAALVRGALRVIYERLSRRGEIDPRLLDPDVEWRPPSNSPMAGLYRGPAEVNAEFASWTEPFEGWRWQPEELTDVGFRDGDWVWLVQGHESGRGTGSGVATEARQFHVLALRRGRLARMEMYHDRSDAMRAARLTES